MARNSYTGSPLGIIHSEKVKYTVEGDSINSIFSSSTSMNKTTSGTLNFRTRGGNFLSQHNDELYDLSTPHIIEKLKNIPALSLRYADFAYLKNYGVYPNNRLVVVRRFETPVPDDLFGVTDIKSPLSTIVGYAEDIGDLVKINVSESWEESDPTLKKLLNDFGNDVAKGVFDKTGLGDYVSGGAGIIPMSNLTTILQRKILQKMGIIGPNDASDLPIADPNIIRESQQRKMVSEENGGSGLKGTFKITLTTEYEQKFINGVDPTIVYMDIINNALQMGTSRSTFFLGRRDDIANKSRDIIEKLSKDPMGALGEWVNAIISSMKESISKLTEMLTDSKVTNNPEEDSEDAKERRENEKNNENNSTIDKIVDVLQTGINSILENVIKKYRHRLLGTITNMTGAASTPWHVTIGNPLRPIFISGDMLCTGVEIDPGNVLAFNNLPSNIKIKITLESARNLGLQEIFAKYNSGSIRVKNGKYVSTGPQDFYSSDNYVHNKPKTQPVVPASKKESPQGPEIDNNNQNTTTQTTRATTNGTQKVNNDANGDNSLIPSTENTGGISNSSTTETVQPITSGPNAQILKS